MTQNSTAQASTESVQDYESLAVLEKHSHLAFVLNQDSKSVTSIDEVYWQEEASRFPLPSLSLDDSRQVFQDHLGSWITPAFNSLCTNRVLTKNPKYTSVAKSYRANRDRLELKNLVNAEKMRLYPVLTQATKTLEATVNELATQQSDTFRDTAHELKNKYKWYRNELWDITLSSKPGTSTSEVHQSSDIDSRAGERYGFIVKGQSESEMEASGSGSDHGETFYIENRQGLEICELNMPKKLRLGRLDEVWSN